MCFIPARRTKGHVCAVMLVFARGEGLWNVSRDRDGIYSSAESILERMGRREGRRKRDPQDASHALMNR